MFVRPARAAVVAVALTLALAGVPGVGRATQGESEALAGVQAVLDARAEAVGDGDRGAFLATVDPSAPAAFRAAQARSFDGLRSVPLASFTLKATTEDWGDLGPGVAGRYGGAPVFLPETEQRHRLADYDDRDVVSSLWLTFVQRDGRWYVGGDADLEDLGLETDRFLWDFGAVEAQRREHVVVLSHPAQAPRAAGLADMAEEAVAAFSARWEQPWSNRVTVLLAGSVDELERLLESTVDLDKFVAFAAYDVERDDGYETSAVRVYVQDDRLDDYPRETQVETLVHELVHLASAPLSGPYVPAWVHEGVAEWLAKDRPAGVRRPAVGDALLPRDYEFSTGSAGAIVRSYRESEAAISVLAGRAGRTAPTAFFAALGAKRVEPGSSDHHVDAALRAAGLPLAELEAAWAARR